MIVIRMSGDVIAPARAKFPLGQAVQLLLEQTGIKAMVDEYQKLKARVTGIKADCGCTRRKKYLDRWGVPAMWVVPLIRRRQKKTAATHPTRHTK